MPVTPRLKPYTLSGEPDISMVEQIDAMFGLLFQDVEAVAFDSLPTPERGAALVVDGDLEWATLTPIVATSYLRFNGTDTEWAVVIESDITNGTLLARVGDAETITGRWFYSTAPVLANNVFLRGRDVGNANDRTLIGLSSGDIVFVGSVTDDLYLRGADDVTIDINGVTLMFGDNVYTDFQVAWVLSNSQAITLSAGNNHDLNVLAATFHVNLTGNVAGSAVTGIDYTSGHRGREVEFVNVAAFDITFRNEDGNSTASRRLTNRSGVDIIVKPGGSVTYRLDADTNGRWLQISNSGPTEEYALTNVKIEAVGYWSPLTNGDGAAPEIVFDSFGDAIAVFTPA